YHQLIFNSVDVREVTYDNNGIIEYIILSSDTDITRGWTDGEVQLSGGAWTDKNGFAPRIKALYFDKSQKQYLRIAGFDPPGTNGYTYIVGWKFAESRSFSGSYEDTFISKRENGANETTILYGRSNKIQYTARSTTKSDVGHAPTITNYESGFNFCVLTCSDDISRSIYTNDIAKTNNQAGEVKGLDEMVGQIFHIGSDGAESGQWYRSSRFYDGYMFYFAVWTRILSDKEIYELQNNLLFNNPTTEQQKDLELFIDFNAPYDDNGVLKFPDLSGNDYQVEARRYVSNGNYPNWGNTLTDLQNSLVDIDSLR
ncbi:MAG: hypothetical protein ACC656_00670, partial [Candidatus Heimdallarchaeota archaeon]